MSVLVLLAERAGEVVTKDEIMRAVCDDVIVSDDALVRCISELRRLLGDNPKEHRVIQTIPKKGYRLVAAVVPLQNAARANGDGATLTLEAVLRASSDYIYVFDNDGHYLQASKSGARALGLASESLIGRSWQEIGMPAEIMEPLQRQVASIFEGGPSVRADVHYPTMFGNCFYEYFLDPVYGVGNQIVAVTAVVHDVTERCRTSQQVARLQSEQDM